MKRAKLKKELYLKKIRFLNFFKTAGKLVSFLENKIHNKLSLIHNKLIAL